MVCIVLIGIDYVGYIVRFPAEDYDDVMTRAMNELNISTPRSVKRRVTDSYPLDTPSKRHRSNSLLQSHQQILNSKNELSCKSEEAAKGIKSLASTAAWGVLVSQTHGYPDIPLTRDSTGLGELCDFVDFYTQERMTEFGNPNADFSC